jgi:hypothetical protein
VSSPRAWRALLSPMRFLARDALERTVNGQPGLVGQNHAVTTTVFAFDIEGEKIKHIWAVRNPDKLRLWTTG